MIQKQKGFAHFGLILFLVIILGSVGFIGWKVISNNSKSPTSQDHSETVASTKQASAAASKEKSAELPDNFIIYENKDVGFKFAYPKAWGTIVRSGDDREDLRTDGLSGRSLRSEFQKGDKSILPTAVELSGETAAATDEGQYFGGYIKKDDGYYFNQKYFDGLAQLPKENILAEVPSPLGTVLIVKAQTICGEYVQLLVNLPAGNPLHGLELRLTTNPDDCPEKADISTAALNTLKEVAGTFEAL